MLASGQNAETTEDQDAETLKDQDAETLKVRKSALRERIETLIAKRSSTYEATAHHVIDTDGLSIDTISRTVIHLLDTTNIQYLPQMQISSTSKDAVQYRYQIPL